jgi:hypothetical protein
MVVLSRSYAALREATQEGGGREVEVGGAPGEGEESMKARGDVVPGSPPWAPFI